MAGPRKRWYVVVRGRKPGVHYALWSEVQPFVNKFPMAWFAGFDDERSAVSFFEANYNPQNSDAPNIPTSVPPHGHGMASSSRTTDDCTAHTSEDKLVEALLSAAISATTAAQALLNAQNKRKTP